MVGSFQKLDELLDFIEALPRRNLKVPRLNFEGFPGRLLAGQAEAQKMIDNLLKRASRAPKFFLERLGDIIIESKCRSHIMMLPL